MYIYILSEKHKKRLYKKFIKLLLLTAGAYLEGWDGGSGYPPPLLEFPKYTSHETAL